MQIDREDFEDWAGELIAAFMKTARSLDDALIAYKAKRCAGVIADHLEKMPMTRRDAAGAFLKAIPAELPDDLKLRELLEKSRQRAEKDVGR